MPKSRLPYTHMRNGNLVVRVPYRDGNEWKSKTATVADQDEALATIQKFKRQLGLLGASAFDGDKMSFAELLDQYRLAHPEMHDYYEEPLRQFFGDRRIKTLTYADCKRFKESRQAIPKRYTADEDRTPATINREVEHLRSVLLYAVRHGWLERSPFTAGPALIEKSRERKRTRVPTPAEEAAILAQCVPPRAHLRALIIATRDTGLRRSALRDITWPCVNWETQFIAVPPAPSGYKTRPPFVAMTERLCEELHANWLAADCPTDGPVFGGIADFKRSWKTARRLAGVSADLRFNDFRHGFATDLLEAGVDERLAMRIAGHNNPETHAIYTNVDQRIARVVADALDQLHARRGIKSTDG